MLLSKNPDTHKDVLKMIRKKYPWVSGDNPKCISDFRTAKKFMQSTHNKLDPDYGKYQQVLSKLLHQERIQTTPSREHQPDWQV